MSLAIDTATPGLDLELSKARIAEAFEPFVARHFGPEDDGDWQAMIAGRGKKILKRRLKRQFLGWMSGMGRAPDVVEAVYEQTWNQPPHSLRGQLPERRRGDRDRNAVLLRIHLKMVFDRQFHRPDLNILRKDVFILMTFIDIHKIFDFHHQSLCLIG